MTDIKTRFMKKVIADASGCWNWVGAKKQCRRGTHRYGWFFYERGPIAAHRAAWMLFNGSIPVDSVVCHKCDNPSCVNPDHLFIGTQKENVEDMIQKGRKCMEISVRKSDGKPVRAILDAATIQQIKAMRETGRSQQSIADEIGVSQGCISQLLRGVTKYAI